MNQLPISNALPEKALLLPGKKIFNFVNLNTVYWFNKNESYKALISKKQNINFSDSRIIALKLGIEQQRGPSFARRFLLSSNAKNKKHFFVGLEKKDLQALSSATGISDLRLNAYNPPYISGLEFSPKEKSKIISLAKKFKPDYIWICVGSPKQEILANQLFDKFHSNYLNIGAAMDFLLEKKKEAPSLFRVLALEWLFRLLTDFKKSKIKVWRSFLGLFYSGSIQVPEK